MTSQANRTRVHVVPRTWLGRLTTAVGAVALLVLAMLFFAVFLTVFVIMGILILARMWWVERQIRRKASQQVIDAEYSVEITETARQEDQSARDDANRC